MGHKKYWSVTCDVRGCQEEIPPQDSRVRGKIVALQKGWQERHNRMLCPTHARKDDERIEEAGRLRRLALAKQNL